MSPRPQPWRGAVTPRGCGSARLPWNEGGGARGIGRAAATVWGVVLTGRASGLPAKARPGWSKPVMKLMKAEKVNCQTIIMYAYKN